MERGPWEPSMALYYVSLRASHRIILLLKYFNLCRIEKWKESERRMSKSRMRVGKSECRMSKARSLTKMWFRKRWCRISFVWRLPLPASWRPIRIKCIWHWEIQVSIRSAASFWSYFFIPNTHISPWSQVSWPQVWLLSIPTCRRPI